MTYPKIKACPRCGKEPFLFGYEGWNGGISSWRVECDPCDGSGGGVYIGSCEGRKLDAIREHNRRALITPTAGKEATTPDHVGRVETGKGEAEG